LPYLDKYASEMKAMEKNGGHILCPIHFAGILNDFRDNYTREI
jgi:hypothetical protein